MHARAKKLTRARRKARITPRTRPRVHPPFACVSHLLPWIHHREHVAQIKETRLLQLMSEGNAQATDNVAATAVMLGNELRRHRDRGALPRVTRHTVACGHSAVCLRSIPRHHPLSDAAVTTEPGDSADEIAALRAANSHLEVRPPRPRTAWHRPVASHPIGPHTCLVHRRWSANSNAPWKSL